MLLNRLLNRLLDRLLNGSWRWLCGSLLHWRLSRSRLLLNHWLLLWSRLWWRISSRPICVNDGWDTMHVVGDGSLMTVLRFLVEVLIGDSVSNGPRGGRRQREVDVAGVDLEVR